MHMCNANINGLDQVVWAVTLSVPQTLNAVVSGKSPFLSACNTEAPDIAHSL